MCMGRGGGRGGGEGGGGEEDREVREEKEKSRRLVETRVHSEILKTEPGH